ncbi:MAG: glycosyltransferase 87 family protein [Gaiellales bacterium]
MSLVLARRLVASGSVLVAVSLAVTLSAGATLKGECFGADGANWRSRPCYNDIQPLYRARGIGRHVFPYIHARLAGDVGSRGFNEYPVLTGLFAWAVGWLALSSSSYLVVKMILLSACAAVTTWLVFRMAGRRAIWWTASPILALYAFHNWDVLAITACVAGLYLWWSGRPRLAALAFAVGGALKWYPLVFVAPLVCDLLIRRRSRAAVEAGAVGIGSFALINLPFVLINASGWWATYRFQMSRAPDHMTTIWAVLGHSLSSQAEKQLSFLMLIVLLSAVTALLLVRANGEFAVVQWCAAATAAVIALNVIGSPQYALWIVPFVALLETSAIWWWLLSAIAVVRYVALFAVGIAPLGMSTADHLVTVTAAAQSIILLAFAAAVVRTSTNVRCRSTCSRADSRIPTTRWMTRWARPSCSRTSSRGTAAPDITSNQDGRNRRPSSV